MCFSSKKFPYAPLIIGALTLIVLGFGVRLHGLGHDSFWFDEVLTVTTAQRGIAAALAETGHPPLHYLFVAAAVSIFGESEFAARLPSLLAGTLAIPLLIVWGRWIKRPYAGWWAALLLALSPFHLRYSQEARHYTWLMLFSLASYIFLHRAMIQKQWRWWLIFAGLTVVNLYTHYAALVVLSSQTVIIGTWILSRWPQQGYRVLVQPAVSAVTVVGLYLAQLPDLLFALGWNLGPDAARGGGSLPVSVWMHEMFNTFVPSVGAWPYLLAAFALFGLWQLRRKPQRHLLLLLSGGLLIPIILIATFQVARWALVKYVIYLLPLYLLAIGIGVDAALKLGMRYWGKHGRYLAIPLVSLIAVVSWSPLLEEYQYIERDWMGATEMLRNRAEADDIVIALSLDSPIGFNAGELLLPYYFDRENVEQTTLAMQRFKAPILEELPNSDATVWAVVRNERVAMSFDDDVRFVEEFQGALYLLEMADTRKPVLDRLISVYTELMPFAGRPVPHCLLKEDLALLYAQKSDYFTAEQLFSEAKTTCPSLVNGLYPGYELVGMIHHGLLAYYQSEGDLQAAREEAFQILALDSKDPKALDMVTAVNLLQVFENSDADVDAVPNVEPVQVRRFIMPHNGDWGDALLIHPPNSVSYEIHIPDEATALYFRAAMAPESWEWGGDGSTFVVLAETETRTAVELLRQHISNEPLDRDWHAFTIPLADFTGQTITLTLTSEPGPAGDFIGDWAGWETPRIIYNIDSDTQR